MWSKDRKILVKGTRINQILQVDAGVSDTLKAAARSTAFKWATWKRLCSKTSRSLIVHIHRHDWTLDMCCGETSMSCEQSCPQNPFIKHPLNYNFTDFWTNSNENANRLAARCVLQSTVCSCNFSLWPQCDRRHVNSLDSSCLVSAPFTSFISICNEYAFLGWDLMNSLKYAAWHLKGS